jgi:hypothetical protein
MSEQEPSNWLADVPAAAPPPANAAHLPEEPMPAIPELLLILGLLALAAGSFAVFYRPLVREMIDRMLRMIAGGY